MTYRGTVFTRPTDLAEDRLIAALAQAWGLNVVDIEYAPVGFGSYHWRVQADDQWWFLPSTI